MTSIAVLSRIYPGEIPYINSFLEYYVKIGVDKFYLINTHYDNKDEIIDFLSKNTHFEKIKLYHLPKDYLELIGCQNNYLQYIEEEYTLNIDIDEYLQITDLKDFCITMKNQDKEIDGILFNWYMNFNDKVIQEDNILEIISKKWTEGKCLFKTKNITQINDHMCYSNIKQLLIIPSNIMLLHLWSRSFNDVIIKSINQRFNDVKSSNLDILLSSLKNNNIPKRFKILAYLKNIECDFKLTTKDSILNINYQKENDLVFKSINHKDYNKLVKLYNLYRYHFSIFKKNNIFEVKGKAYIYRLAHYVNEINLEFEDINELKLPVINNLIINNQYIYLPQQFIDNENHNFYPDCNVLLRHFQKSYLNYKKLLITIHPILKLYLFYQHLETYKGCNNRILSFKNKITGYDFNEFIINFINKIDINLYHFTQLQTNLLISNDNLNTYDYQLVKYEKLNKKVVKIPNLDDTLLGILKDKIIVNTKLNYTKIKAKLDNKALDIISEKYEDDLKYLDYQI